MILAFARGFALLLGTTTNSDDKEAKRRRPRRLCPSCGVYLYRSMVLHSSTYMVTYSRQTVQASVADLSHVRSALPSLPSLPEYDARTFHEQRTNPHPATATVLPPLVPSPSPLTSHIQTHSTPPPTPDTESAQASRADSEHAIKPLHS